MADPGALIIISSPSGAGKTTLTKRLIVADPKLRLSVSATTRTIRPGEREGVDYYFWSRERFERERDAGGFLEHAVVFDRLYGTPMAPVQTWVGEGYDVVFDIDWQGARQLRTNPIAELVSVFILPPSLTILEDRLRKRAADPEDVIQRRMSRAVDEISHWREYDYVVVNEDLDAATAALTTIIDAHRENAAPKAAAWRSDRQAGLPVFVDRLMAQSTEKTDH